MVSVMIHVGDEITDVVDDAEKLLNLPFGKLLIWKVKQFLSNVISRLVVAIFDDHTKELILSVAMVLFLADNMIP